MIPSSANRPRLLVVDDNVALTENLAEILQDAGYDVKTATTCAAAMVAAEGGIDVALVDLRLPDGDGTVLASKLSGLHPDCEVILLTGFATIESAAAAVRAGAWAYLVKPCATPELLLAVEQAMRQATLRTEKRELSRRAQVAEKLAAVGTLTAGLSHEIRNPLNAAALQLTVLDRRVRKLDVALQGPLLEPLTLVRDEIKRLDHILQDFLLFARPVQFTPARVELYSLAKGVHTLLLSEAERRGLTLILEADERDVPVLGEENRLRQVLMNLVLNALEATPKGGQVRVACLRSGNREALLEVADTGPGIPAELLPRLFEPFMTTKASGSGLGLPIVHSIVGQHGGTVSADNLPGGGAVFVVRLPMAV